MDEERNLNSPERLDLLVFNEDDYTEEEFSKFLNGTKESLAKMTISKENICDVDDSKSDRDFSKFLGQLKSSFCSNKSYSNVLTVQNRSQYSNSVSTPKSEDSFKKDSVCEKRSLSTSAILCEIEEESLMNFSKKRVSISEKLYKFFNKKIFDNKLPEDLEIIWTNGLKTTAGKTYASRTGDKYHCSKITLSSSVLTSFERLRDTLLHEMCHAAVFAISQIRESSHGPLWQTWAARCNLIFPDIDVPQRCHDYEISYPYYYKCDKCDLKIGRCRMSEKLSNALCRNCHCKLSLVKS